MDQVYHVGKKGKWQSFTQCLLALKDDDTSKTIILEEGIYDIFREYRKAGVPRTPRDLKDINDYMPYNVIVPPNTHIIGEGRVSLCYMPQPGDTYETESHVVSPLNVSGSATIENLEIHCQNGRYCIHDETLGLPQFAGAKKNYINVKTYKHFGEEGLGHVSGIGFGFDNRMDFTFTGCEFYNEMNVPFYMHNRTKNKDGYVFPIEESGSVTLNNCIIDARSGRNAAVFLGNCAPMLHHVVQMNGCRIRGYILAADEKDRSGGTRRNAYDFRLNGCSETEIIIADKNNEYKPQIVLPQEKWEADGNYCLDQVIAE